MKKILEVDVPDGFTIDKGIFATGETGKGEMLGGFKTTSLIVIDVNEIDTHDCDLINWAELSRLLCGDRSSLTRKRISKKHRAKVAALIQAVEDWKKRYL